MKIAISVPDETFERVTKRAKELGTSRSELFSRAATHYHLDELDAASVSHQTDLTREALGDTGDSAAAVLAHNLRSWSALLGEITAKGTFLASKTKRTRFISVAARHVNASGRLVLRGPKHWPWAQQFLSLLSNLRALEPATG